MLLKSLEIQGFKSFPDKTLLHFGKGITAVVGPNGSGKSNISDAIRWVLGEQSTKTLRGGKMEDVIFGGTVSRKAQGFAEVSLTVDNTARRLGVESDEVTVTRRYYRSGESEYLLNGKEVRLKDINEIFMDTGLGRDGYSIISQGRIAEIVAAKSEDRREIFEEAAGISKFRYKKEESERRLNAAEENLVRLHDILSELEGRIGPLKEQAQQAKKYLALVSEKRTLETGLWIFSLDRQRGQLRESENRISLANSQFAETGKKIEEIDGKIERIYFESQKKAAQIDDLRSGSHDLEEQAMNSRSSAQLLENDILHNNENMENIRSEIQDAQASREQSEKELCARRKSMEAKEQEKERLQSALARCEEDLGDLQRRSEEISGELAGADRRLAALQDELSQAQMSKLTAGATLEHTRERMESITAGLAEKNARLQQAQGQLADIGVKKDGCAEKMAELSNALQGYEIKLRNRTEKLHTAEEAQRSLMMELTAKNQRVEMLQELERNLEGFSGSVKLILREKDHGSLRGIHGPVSRLIQVPQEYTVAIETALGGALQNIVVDDEEAAKASIRFLRRNNGGRATFLPLTSIKGHPLNGTFSQYPGYIGLANSLIAYHSRYEGVMLSLLGRTVVAKDLDSAVEIARGSGFRFKVVTLDGQVVNAGGSMTGGSQQRSAGLLSRAGEIERLRKEAQQMKTRLEQMDVSKKAVQQEVSALEASVSGLKGEAATAQEEKIRIEGEIKRLSELAGTLQRETGSLSAEREEAQAKISGAETSAAQADAAIADLEEKIGNLKTQMETIGGGRNELLKKHGELGEDQARLRLQAMAAGKDIEAIRLGMINLQQQMAGHGEKIESLTARVDELAAKNGQARQQIQQLTENAEKLAAQAQNNQGKIQEIVSARQELEQESVRLREREKSLNDDKAKLTGELGRLEERKAAVQAEMDSVIAKLWDEYGLTRSEAEKTAVKITEPQQSQRRLNEIKAQIKQLGDVNVGAIEEYKQVSERYGFMSTQVGDVEKSRDELIRLIADLTKKMRSIFTEQFAVINRNFAETFTELFGGGTAGLRLTEPDDVLSSGIEINVQPPGKIIKNLAALSGGEQSFVAIALFFAILKVRPSPFCVLDEIEAALDDVNVGRFAAYLRRMCGNTQFIVITHRRGTMDEADVLYGVTMQEEGVSKLLTLNVSELVEKRSAG